MKTLIKKFCLLFLLLISQINLKSQNLQWAYGFGGAANENFTSITKDGAENIYIAGYFSGTVDFDPGPGILNLTSNGGQDICLLKYTNQGQILWAKNIGGTGNDGGQGTCIKHHSSGFIYLSGTFEGSNIDMDPGPGISNLSTISDPDLFFAKFDEAGNFIWAKSIDAEPSETGSNTLSIDNLGNIYIVGRFAATVDFDPGAGTANLSSLPSLSSIFFAKYSSDGNYVWAKNINPTFSSVGGNGITLDHLGNLFICGYFGGSNIDFDPGAGTANFTSTGVFDLFVAKYDTSGNYQWAYNFGGASTDNVPYTIACDLTGNVYVGGYYQGIVDVDPGPGVLTFDATGKFSENVLIKYSPTGSLVWAKTFGSESWDGIIGISIDNATGYVYAVGGTHGDTLVLNNNNNDSLFSTVNGDDFEIFITQFDASGNITWGQLLGSGQTDIALGVIPDNNNNIYVTGYFQNSTIDFDSGPGETLVQNQGGADAYIIKLSKCSKVSITLNNYISVEEDSDITLTANITGQPETIEWRKNGLAISTGNSNFLTITQTTLNDEGNYSVFIIDSCKNETLSSNIFLDVKPLCQVYQLITPNGDGKNDFLFVRNANLFPDNEIIILNKWGQIVFQQKSYNNTWTADNLPDGSYYYHLKVASENIDKKGMLLISRH
jgi:gliding motility-associated-like protein